MNKTYAFSDVHGIYDLWTQIRDYCDETDTIYFLGDACDRGKDGLKIINELLNDKRVRYLKGNHEDMLTICVPEFIEGHFNNMPWWASNGGFNTWKAIQTLTDEEKMALVYKLENLPKYVWYQNKQGQKIFLSHAGTDLNYTEKELIIMGRKDPYIWDREHFFASHPIDKQNVFQIHGHTPVVHLRRDYNFFYPEIPVVLEVFNYCNGHKFNIDMASFATGISALIDLDNFSIKYFQTTEGLE